jgi:hypothetical protein
MSKPFSKVKFYVKTTIMGREVVVIEGPTIQIAENHRQLKLTFRVLSPKSQLKSFHP